MKNSDDLVKRLRELYVSHGISYVQEAADEIERLQKDAARYLYAQKNGLIQRFERDPMGDCYCNSRELTDSDIDAEIKGVRDE